AKVVVREIELRLGRLDLLIGGFDGPVDRAEELLDLTDNRFLDARIPPLSDRGGKALDRGPRLLDPDLDVLLHQSGHDFPGGDAIPLFQVDLGNAALEWHGDPVGPGQAGPALLLDELSDRTNPNPNRVHGGTRSQ